MGEKIPRSFYQGPDVVQIARQLIGKKLCTFIGDRYTSGLIVETEAYSGRNDKACHADNNRRTPRTEVMYQAGGLAYVYLCYGIHHLFNIVTNTEGLADAVLLRAVEPVDGLETMLQRRNMQKPLPALTAGPGAMSAALGITTRHYGTDLSGPLIWLEEAETVPAGRIIASTRVGVAYAQEDALKPWRFRLKDSTWTSRAK